MKTEEVWTSQQNRLWMHNGGHPEYLFYSGIFRCLWNSGKKPRVIVYGYLPQSKWILETPENFDLEVRGGVVGNPMDYTQGQQRSFMPNCRVVNKWIPRFLSLDEDHPIKAFINIECSSIEVIA